MRELTIAEYLRQLADRVPAPGGGAVAALHAAQGAALVAMAARYSTGEGHAEAAARITAEADALRAAALRLAEEDAEAFTAVTEAYRLPSGTAEEQAVRSAAVAGELVRAARPPAEVVGAADRIVALAEELLPFANPRLLSDVAAASDAARAAATTARLNVEINLAGVPDAAAREPLSAAAARTDAIAERADRLAATVRERIAG